MICQNNFKCNEVYAKFHYLFGVFDIKTTSAKDCGDHAIVLLSNWVVWLEFDIKYYQPVNYKRACCQLVIFYFCSGSKVISNLNVTSSVVQFFTVQWRHNERDGVFKHWCIYCSLNHLFRRRSQKTSKLRVNGLCEGNSPVTGEFPLKGPLTRKLLVNKYFHTWFWLTGVVMLVNQGPFSTYLPALSKLWDPSFSFNLKQMHSR